MGRYEDLTGRQFGKWTVTSEAPRNKQNGIMWNVICECGTKAVKYGGDLRTGRAKQCKRCYDKEQTKDILGQTFGKYTVISYEGSNGTHAMWKCKCSCGKENIICGGDLRRGVVTQCRDCAHKQFITHNGTGTPLHNLWRSIKMRTTNPNIACYKYYGAKNVKMCSEWLNDFSAFRDWALENGYKKGLQIDRIDFDGDYESSNCRFVDVIEQANNKSNNFVLEYNGEKKTLAQWCRVYNMGYSTVYSRIKYLDWDIATALTTPKGEGENGLGQFRKKC